MRMMHDQPWLKLLELVRHNLGARDARLEIGGQDPTEPHLVWSALEEGRRLVVVFDTPPAAAEVVRDKLKLIVDGFRSTLQSPAEAPTGRLAAALHRELDLALAELGERTGAETVWIIDYQSPMIWGSSEARSESLDLDLLLLTARADQMLSTTKLTWAELLAAPEAATLERLREAGLIGMAQRAVYDEHAALRALSEEGGLAAAMRRLRSARALAEIRARAVQDHALVRSELRGPDIQCFAHSLAGQYQLVLVFDETYSPLHAEGNVQRALPHIERLLLSLPPVDPISGGGAKVLRMPRKG